MTRDEIAARLRAAGSVFAEDEADVLLGAATGDPEGDLESMIRRRVAGEPLEVVVGWAEFRGLRIAVEAGVFVPRRRTEFVVETALALDTLRDPASHAVAVDLCCGSGAVGAALVAARPGVELTAADIDPRAVRVARRNVRPCDVVVEGDLYDALPAGLRGRVDVILANAPYVPSDEVQFMPREARDAEPLHALDGGATGTELHARIAHGASEWLTPGGVVVIETSKAQAAQTAGHLQDAGFDTFVHHSSGLDATCVVGVHRDDR
ncbi:hypothetical protein AX769_19835 [Frondihabitans sp. PAMC 28766]|uniref:putative protein N(5)-glutamine methyltransferase n=1 Tax=Frondihabitans sp. PAMC 28766 TaxID=1795630 RepID=UPI00078CBAC7|nr:putative protein N(5)-glutamine methyltransferase [Frondihabitans sp. PAMC 28766]AMM21985.1 hypothetical protein AX769_19835 [Frondihabitans sp. PAMC 28766]